MVRFEPLLPTVLPDDYSPPDCLRIAQELAEAREARERCDIEAVDEIARLLKFNRKEEGRGNVLAFDVSALKSAPQLKISFDQY